jgi:hypothetical protein
MGQRTLGFTRLLLREVSCNTLENHKLLVVYAKQSFIQHTWGITKEQYTKHMQQSEHRFNKFSICKNYNFFGNSIIYIYISSSRRACSRSRILCCEIIELLLLVNSMSLASAIPVYPSSTPPSISSCVVLSRNIRKCNLLPTLVVSR